MVSEQNLDELEDPDTWDWESQKKGRPEPSGTSVVGVTLSDEEFDRVEELARRKGVTVSALIRHTVLAAVERNNKPGGWSYELPDIEKGENRM